MNASDSMIQGIPRINEVSSHFQDTMRELLNATPGLSCNLPHTAAGRVQRSGYPDLRLFDQETKRVYYLDPKLYAVASRDGKFPHILFRAEERDQQSARRIVNGQWAAIDAHGQLAPPEKLRDAIILSIQL